MAFTKSAPAGILLSAATFGAAHAYQGFRMTILIALYGAMFGILAYWPGTVRPGMISHALAGFIERSACCNEALESAWCQLTRS